jgi:hypothetical protein
VKVSELKELLNKFQDDEDICALVWDKTCFDYSEEDEFTLTREAWAETCSEFDEMEFLDIGNWISDTVTEKAEFSTAR